MLCFIIQLKNSMLKKILIDFIVILHLFSYSFDKVIFVYYCAYSQLHVVKDFKLNF
jgi:hypothetical protein